MGLFVTSYLGMAGCRAVRDRRCPAVRDRRYRSSCRPTVLQVIIARDWRGRAINHCPDRHFNYFRPGCAAVLLLTLAVSAAPGLDDRLVEKIRQIIGVGIGAENHIPAAATIAAIRAPSWNEFFAPKTDATPPTVTSLGKNSYAIDKHGFPEGGWEPCHRRDGLSSRAVWGPGITKRSSRG